MSANSLGMRAGISALAFLAASPAFAQDEQPSAENEGGIGEIVVTAQKRAQNLQDVPISIAAVSGEMIGDLQAATLQGLQGAVPNIQIGNFSNTPNTAVFTIRGIGVIEPDPYAGNTVGIVVDGVPQFFSMGALLDLFDVQRIEILRGPQGTLFGANTTGGVVNVINNTPTNQLEAKVNASFGNYAQTRIGAIINVPLGEGVAFRIAAQNDRSDGFVTNVVNGDDMGERNVTLLRAALRAESGNFTALLTGEYVASRNGSPIVVAGNLPGEAEFVPPGFQNMYVSPCLPAGSRCNAPDKYLSARDGGPLGDTPDQSDMNNYRVSLELALSDTAIGDITSISGYRQFDLFEFTDQDGSPVFLIDTRRGTEGWQFSQELRTDFSIGDRIDVTMGGFYMKTHYNHYQDLRIDFAGGAEYDLVNQTVTKGLTGLFQKNQQDQDNHSLSGFIQTYFQVTDALRLQGGIRYSYEKTSMLASTATSLAESGVSTFDGTNPDGTPNIPLGTVAPPRGRESWNNVGWKLGADYKATEDVMLYGSWARGFKSGGFTGRIGIAEDLGPYDPETVDTFEIGMKGDFLDRRLRVNLAVFQTNYDDIQLAQIYFIGSGENLVQGNTIINAASSRIRGFEAEVTAAPIDGLTITGALAYLDAEYRNFDFLLPSGGTIDLRGERMQNAPDWSGSTGFNYEFALMSNLEARFGANYSYTSEKLLTSILDVPRARVQPQHLVNANFDVTVNDKLTVGLWATNLLDNRYINSVFDAPGTLGLVNYAPPRRYGVSLSADF